MKKLRIGKLCFAPVVVLLLSVAIIISMPAIVSADGFEGKGDINGDGLVDYLDFECLKNYILGMTYLSPSQIEQGDLNNNGVIDPEDLELFPRLITVIDIPLPYPVVIGIPEGKGDINGDGLVDYVDTIFIREYLLGKRNLSNTQLEQADVNDDGEVNNRDFEVFPLIPAGTVFGDIDNSGTFDAIDMALFRSYLLGSTQIEPNPQKRYVWDANADGNIDSIDFAFLKRYSLGEISELPIHKYVKTSR
jgi:hypothetical protein